MCPTNGSDSVLNTNAVVGPRTVARPLCVGAVLAVTVTGASVDRRGELLDDEVEQPVDADRPGGGADDDGREPRAGEPVLGAGDDVLLGQRALLEVLLDQARRRTRRPPRSASRGRGRPSRAGRRATRTPRPSARSGRGRPSRAGGRRRRRTRAPGRSAARTGRPGCRTRRRAGRAWPRSRPARGRAC